MLLPRRYLDLVTVGIGKQHWMNTICHEEVARSHYHRRGSVRYTMSRYLNLKGKILHDQHLILNRLCSRFVPRALNSSKQGKALRGVGRPKWTDEDGLTQLVDNAHNNPFKVASYTSSMQGEFVQNLTHVGSK
jgi:hypothetical protein